MAVLKLSQIAAAGSAPAASDVAVGVTGGTTDNLFSYTQVATTVFNTVGLTIGSAKINSGTTNRLFYDNAGVIGEATVAGSLTLSGGTLSVTAGGIASPTTSVQFNNGGQFGGDSGFTYAGSGQATLALGTITTNLKALNITGTWNAAGVTFDAPLFMNITNTASASGSMLMDLQTGGASKFKFYPTGDITITRSLSGGTHFDNGLSPGQFGISDATFTTALVFTADTSGITKAAIGWSANLQNGFFGSNNSLVGFVSGSNAIVGGTDTSLFRDAAVSILALGNFNSNTTAATFRVYNTTDNVATNTAPTNYERAAFDWTTTANVLTIGPQKGGTGTLRYMQHTVAFAAATINTQTASYSQLLTDQWIVFNSASIMTLTLLSAATFPGLSLWVLTINTGTVISASSNVIPRAGGSAGTAICSGTAGSWALLVSNGTNWQIMAGA